MTKRLKNIESYLKTLREDESLELKFEFKEGELEPAQEEVYLELKERGPKAAIAGEFNNGALERFLILDRIESAANSFLLMEFSQKKKLYRMATLMNDGVWDINELDSEEDEELW